MFAKIYQDRDTVDFSIIGALNFSMWILFMSTYFSFQYMSIILPDITVKTSLDPSKRNCGICHRMLIDEAV